MGTMERNIMGATMIIILIEATMDNVLLEPPMTLSTLVGEISITEVITVPIRIVTIVVIMALVTTMGIVMDVIITEITIILITTNPREVKEVKEVKMEVIMITITTTTREVKEVKEVKKVKKVKEVKEVKGGTMVLAAIIPREVKVDTNILVTIHDEDIC